ncbi:MlaD family protein [Patulibacter sp.]|uniref:MlaD family protein n=1 Tax=Patulibacter sp. TaxID=1912859 RepID=UPI00271B4D13|nr:MlaD family protein [Patulibacter sp.]MDO9409155.1 MlaD family protein [Patulibacter sp.]
MSKGTTQPPNRRTRISPVKFGALFLLVVAIGVYFGFAKSVPFRSHYEVSAVVRTSNLLAKGSPVRIAGVKVGKVVDTGRYGKSEYAVIRMQVDEDGRKVLRRDASIRIRPRLFLEGNFYVELQPGTPDAPSMPDGGTIPVTRTSVPVQLDQVLTTLQADQRKALQATVGGLGDGFGSTPTAKEDASQDEAVRGKTGGQALNEALKTSPQSLRDGAKVTTDLRGRVNGDLTKAIAGIGDVTAALAQDQRALSGAVRNFDTTVSTLADNSGSLQSTVRELGRTSSTARIAFGSLRRALPPTRTTARDLTAAMRELPGVITAGRPWLRQAAPLLSEKELRGLLGDVRPTLQDIARLTRESRTWVPELSSFTACMNRVFLPTLNVKVDDGPLSANVENYKEFWYGVVGMAGEGQTFDGNGSKLRLQTIGGNTKVKTGYTTFGRDQPQFANATERPTGTSPAFSPKVPAFRTDVRCATNPVPPVNGPASQGPADGSRPSAPAPAAPNLDPIPGKVR